ncbi:hypothetical protein FBY51_0467 [Zymomonas mobilis]|uniref:hypothetical protein n=1 Tax=Zymomonas mobilis TaxID=542 RepID=UPI00026D871D|nr:hypothetical protein [Zymomonas mobilis]AFN56689.1 hypothetical protein ZZ6_0795 [Zymomonas mobilis subsp. mobilis ATCC 29191]TQK77880.1 hypothetical protein FBY53_0523 [Zymomonas mobilis]TQL15475.1 hypothetical protein FBY51_0467 [Zymomonas mobilis]GEB87043.1 hypothetical protein ZMO01_03830 [Zymomonas mobilis subsp. mobilis]
MIIQDDKKKIFSAVNTSEKWLIDHNTAQKTPLATGHFSQLEWDVIYLGLREAKLKHRKTYKKATKKTNGLRRFWHWMTGIEPPKNLADEKLEALRSFAFAHARKEDHRHLERQLNHHGYNAQQIKTIASLTAGKKLSRHHGYK